MSWDAPAECCYLSTEPAGPWLGLIYHGGAWWAAAAGDSQAEAAERLAAAAPGYPSCVVRASAVAMRRVGL